MLRVERSFKANAWAENPPARTRRIVGNVEITGIQGDEISVVSAFHLHCTRPGSPSFLSRAPSSIPLGPIFTLSSRAP